MAFKSSVEIDKIIKNYENPKKLIDLFSLNYILKNSFYLNDCPIDEEIKDIIILNNLGRNLYDFISANLEKDGFKNSEILFAIFLKFSYDELFIDHINTNIDELILLINKLISLNKIILPYKYGRNLYDIFNDNFKTNRVEELEYFDSLKLISNTEQGVYQINNYLTGPLGIITTDEKRLAPPTLKLPLWHCSDTGCKRMHTVKLKQGHNIFKIIYKIKDHLILSGLESEWQKAFIKSLNTKSNNNIIQHLGDCIVNDEKKSLLLKLLDNSSINSKIRNILGQKTKYKCNNLELVNKLTEATIMQLLLTLNTESLIKALDECVFENIIKIPDTEIRTAKSFITSSPINELSSRGNRIRQDKILTRLLLVILQLYKKLDIQDDLEWSIRKYKDTNIEKSLFDYIHNESFNTIINELIIFNRKVIKHIAKEHFIPDTIIDSDQLYNYVIWKLGFDSPQFDSEYLSLKNELSKFEIYINSINKIETDDIRKNIRTEGVNLFVMIEKYIDTLVSYNVWFLFNDHYISNFKYDYNFSRNLVTKIIGESVTNEFGKFCWRTDCINLFGVSGTYLNQFIKIIENFDFDNLEKYKRPKKDLPHYYGDYLKNFRFYHKHLWADASIDQLKEYLITFKTIYNDLSQSKYASIRNGIDHYKEPEVFPSLEKIKLFLNKFKKAFDNIETNKLYPNRYWLEHLTTNRNGSVIYELIDYDDKKVIIHGPSSLFYIPPITFDSPIIIAFGNLIGYKNEKLYFKIQSNSEYSKYWINYPKRREIPPADHKE